MTTKGKPGRPRGKSTGRKSKYRRTWPKRAQAMAAEGILEKDMADAFGISISSFFKYKREHPELSQAIEDGHAELIPKVEAALLKTALGYEAEEVTTTIDSSGGVTVRTTRKQIEPNQKAIEFFLTNKSNEWRRKKQVEHSGGVDNRVTVSAPILNFRDMTPEEEPTLEEFLKQQQEKKGKENEH